jgi:cytoskeletal protein CcmA (bactofilin family)
VFKKRKPQETTQTQTPRSNASLFPTSPAGQPGTASSQTQKENSAMARPPIPSGIPQTSPSRSAVTSPKKEQRTLVVGAGISVQGSVENAERLVVEGTVETTLIKATELSVSNGGLFKGGIEVENAEISGTIDGTLVVSGNLTVCRTGRLLGKATCRSLKVEEGGQITGQLEMLKPAAAPVSEETQVDAA